MSYDQAAVMQVCTIKSTCSQSNPIRIFFKMDSLADTFVVGSNVLVVHNHSCYVDIYSFDKEIWHQNTSTVDTAIMYEDPITHAFMILMIKEATKIDSMSNILVIPVQCCMNSTAVNECSKFLSYKPTEDDHTLLMDDHDGNSPPLTITLSLDGVTSYFKARCPILTEYEDMTILKYHLTSRSPPWDPLISLYSSWDEGMVNYRGQITAKCLIVPHSLEISLSLVVSEAFICHGQPQLCSCPQTIHHS